MRVEGSEGARKHKYLNNGNWNKEKLLSEVKCKANGCASTIFVTGLQGDSLATRSCCHSLHFGHLPQDLGVAFGLNFKLFFFCSVIY